jgi:putative DNA primase/helicase
VLAADDDWKTPGNPGLTAAKEAARAVGGLIAKPSFDDLPRGDHDTDFNDQARLERERETSS